MNDLQIFENGDFGQVRIIDETTGDLWFVAKDVAKALGYRDAAELCRRLDTANKDKVFVVTSGGKQEVLTISEIGFYHAIAFSRKKVAHDAKKKMFSMLSGAKTLLEAINDFEIPEDIPDMFVYAIMEEDTKNIKLGISRNPEARLKQLQIGNSSRLHLVGYRKAENRFKDEKTLHQKNEAYRIHGEWFSNESLNSIAI